MNWSRIVPGTIRDLLSNRRPVLRSDGTFVRDYVHVDDIVSAYLRLSETSQIKNLNGEAFNFSRDEPLTVLSLYREISLTVAGKYIEPEIRNSAKSEIKDQHLNSGKAHSVLGWKSSVTLQSGLEKTFNWYKTYLAGR